MLLGWGTFWKDKHFWHFTSAQLRYWCISFDSFQLIALSDKMIMMPYNMRSTSAKYNSQKEILIFSLRNLWSDSWCWACDGGRYWFSPAVTFFGQESLERESQGVPRTEMEKGVNVFLSYNCSAVIGFGQNFWVVIVKTFQTLSIQTKDLLPK